MTYFNRIAKRTLLVVFAATIIWACTAPEKKAEESAEEAPMAEPITLTKAPASPEYADASLSLNNMNVEAGDSSFTASFDFAVGNYELGAQTEGADTRGIANSGKGQHIHFIVNNGPYSAHYESAFEKEMQEGQYVLLAFLSNADS